MNAALSALSAPCTSAVDTSALDRARRNTCWRFLDTCNGAAPLDGVFANVSYANLIRRTGYVGSFRPFCDAG